MIGIARRRVPLEESVVPSQYTEIEYIATTGNCIINTDYIPYGSDITIEGKFRKDGYTDNTDSVQWFGNTASGGQALYSIRRYGATINNITCSCWEKFVNTPHIYGNIKNGTDCEFTITKSSCVLNGQTMTSSFSNPLAENTNPLYVFTEKFIGRCYYLKFTKNGTVVCDLIPVRVGQVGYLYDKVSGKLFGNSGTGSLILGPDKAS